MSRNQKDFTYDNSLLLKDAGAVTSTTAGTVGGSAKTLNLGSGRFDGRVIVDISGLAVANTDNLYHVELQVSPDSGFATTVIVAGALRLGHATATGLTGNSTTGRYEIHFTNEVNGTVYPWVRINNRVAGTSPSINDTAFIVAEA